MPCSVTSAGTTGMSMTSRVRCTQPPVRAVWHWGQDSGAWITRCVGSIRGRAKPWGRFRRGFFSCSGGFLRLAAGLWPGIPAPGPPPPDNRASRLSTRRRSSPITPGCPVMTPCCSPITASRVSRLACSKSSPVSIVPLGHNSAHGRQPFPARRRTFGKSASPTLNSCLTFAHTPDNPLQC